MMWNHGTDCFGGGFNMMMFGGVFMLVFWGLVIWLIILAIRKLSQSNKADHAGNAVDLLRQRYARGEIDTEEYKQRLNELKDTSKN